MFADIRVTGYLSGHPVTQGTPSYQLKSTNKWELPN